MTRVEALGWAGVLVPGVRLFGVTADVVARVDARAHARRSGPVLDRDVLATWEWPEARREPEVVRLVGALCANRSWRRARTEAVRLGGFCATAVVLADAPEECLLECAYAGVGVVVGGEVLVTPRPGRVDGARRRTLDRWVEEVVYERLLTLGLAPAASSTR
ncbi:hypothetical protein [Actinosynnema sp. NPDC020468]|uniref:hypothetical protein n=1 Tax=Actinosynnema sp. NPDC020468 TaxID=3154488 RepID=UPI0033FD27EF